MVLRHADYDADHKAIPGAMYRDLERVSERAQEIKNERRVIIYCVLGRSVTCSVHDAPRKKGIKAYFLEGEITAWRDVGFETVSKSAYLTCFHFTVIPSFVVGRAIIIIRSRN